MVDFYLYDFEDRFSDEMTAALGRFIVQWSRFEYELGLLYSNVLGGPTQRNLCVFYSGSGFSAHRDALKTSVAYTPTSKPPDALNTLLTSGEKLASIRNDLVHGCWRKKSDILASVMVYKPRSKDKSYSFDVDPGTL